MFLYIERRVSLSRSIKHKVVIDAFTGDELKQYINNLGIAKLKERDFVQGIVEYCSHPVNRVLSISGLRGTGKRGVLFESIIVAHTKMVADKYNNALYYYHDTNNREVDLIIERQTMDEFDDVYLYYEIKMTRDPNIVVVKSKWINDSAVNKFAEAQGTVVGKGIIYGGDTQVFSGFTDKNMLPPKGMSLQDIERQNNGIELIAAEDYLLHTEDKLQALERYEV